MRKQGFTLIELLTTVVIMGILSVVTVSTIRSGMDEARNAKTINALATYQDFFDRYYILYEKYPATTVNEWTCLGYSSTQSCYSYTYTGGIQTHYGDDALMAELATELEHHSILQCMTRERNIWKELYIGDHQIKRECTKSFLLFR